MYFFCSDLSVVLASHWRRHLNHWVAKRSLRDIIIQVIAPKHVLPAPSFIEMAYKCAYFFLKVRWEDRYQYESSVWEKSSSSLILRGWHKNRISHLQLIRLWRVATQQIIYIKQQCVDSLSSKLYLIAYIFYSWKISKCLLWYLGGANIRNRPKQSNTHPTETVMK